MKKTITKTQRLAVTSETIRKLDVNRLDAVRGGNGSLNMGYALTCACPTGCCTTQQ